MIWGNREAERHTPLCVLNHSPKCLQCPALVIKRWNSGCWELNPNFPLDDRDSTTLAITIALHSLHEWEAAVKRAKH